jgi:hypothetical protein
MLTQITDFQDDFFIAASRAGVPWCWLARSPG